MQDEDHHGERGALGQELLAGEGQAGAACEEFEQREEQKGDHAAKDQAEHALLFMDVDGAHRQGAFDQGNAFLRPSALLGALQHLGGVQVSGVGAEHVAAIESRAAA
jgi:hypothetical protein